MVPPGGEEDDQFGPPEREQPAHDDGVPADPPLKKRRGLPPGSPKPPGSGRKKATPNNTPPAETVAAILGKGEAYTASFERLLDIGLGKPIDQVGPTGKRFKAPAAASLQVTALNAILGKVVADQSQRNSSIQIDAKAEIKHEVEPTNRALARAVLDILRTAKLEEMAPEQLDRLDLKRRRLTADDIAVIEPKR